MSNHDRKISISDIAEIHVAELHKTPSDVKRELDNKRAESDIKNTFKCCSGSVDVRCLKFFVQATLSISIVALCAVQLVNDDENIGIYTGLLGTVFGYWCNSPSIIEK